MAVRSLGKGARLVACAFVVATASTTTISAASPAAAANWKPGACAGASGVTVVVDATNVGGGIEVRCALGEQATGWDALANAGHAIGAVPTDPGAVCTIDDRPADGYPACWATKFWSYWHAPNTKPGAAWAYSGVGAQTHHPAPGSAEGWRFIGVGTKAAPGAGPVFASPPPSSTTTTTRPSPAIPSPPRPGTGVAPPGAARPPDAPASDGIPTASTAPTPAKTAPTTRAPGAPTTAAASETASESRPTETGSDTASGDSSRPLAGVGVSSHRDASGIPWATIVGAALILALAGGAAAVAYRRRTAHSEA